MRIIDKILQPFEIEVDSDQYTVLHKTTAKESGKENEKPIGYYRHLSNALSRIAKEQIINGNEVSVSLPEFIHLFKEQDKALMEAIKM